MHVHSAVNGKELALDTATGTDLKHNGSREKKGKSSNNMQRKIKMKNNMHKFYPYMCTYTCVHACVPREVCELSFSNSEAEVLGFMKGLIPAPSCDPFSASWYENLVSCTE